MARVYVMWDESHLWGVLVVRALRALGLAHGILRAHDIAEGALSGKSGLVIVPGGWARGKALRLGQRGRAELRGFVERGGAYLGFCGGAGLALSSPRPEESLGLSPWGRLGFAGRLQHFLSGQVRLGLDPAQPMTPQGAGEILTPEILAPVWWPAQFAPPAAPDPSSTVLARYAGLGRDFWVADLDLSLIPDETLADWENLYGLQIRPDFLAGRPAVIAGTCGKGRFVLSYPHLETPQSPQANVWFRHLLEELAGVQCQRLDSSTWQAPVWQVPAWRADEEDVRWPDPALLAARAAVAEAIAVGQSHMLLFWRNSWLLGWRRGVPGPGINSLHALLGEALSCEPTDAALDYWRGRSAEFARLAELFRAALSGWLLAERLDMTVRQTPQADPEGGQDLFAASLKDTRRALFGLPPAIGGVCGELLGMLEELCGRLWTLPNS